MRYEKDLKKNLKTKSASKQRLKLRNFSMYLWDTNFEVQRVHSCIDYRHRVYNSES